MHPISLKRNISWTFIGNVVYAICQWAMLAVLAKITSPNIVGQYALALAIAAPVFAFSNLQTRDIQATDVLDESRFGTFIGFRIISSLFALLIIMFIALYSNYGFKIITIIIIIGVAKVIESFSDVTYGLMQKHEHMNNIAISMIIKGLLSFATFYCSIVYYNSLIVAAIALVLSYITLLLFYDLKIVHVLLNNNSKNGSIYPIFNQKEFRKLLFLALPLGCVILLNTLNINVPRYFIADIFGEEALGYYSAIAYLLVAGSTVVNAIGQSAMPRLAQFYQTDRIAYKKLLIKVLLLAFLVGGVGIVISLLLGEYILTFLYTIKYSIHNKVLIWTMIGSLFLYCAAMLGCGISAARDFRSQLFVGLFVTCAVVIFSYLLIPKYGIIGGAISLSIGFMFKLIGQSVIVYYLIIKE